MTEIRPIKETEAESFLQLLCDVFQLDFNRAYNAFFTEPYFSLQRKWALFEGPQIVSALQVVPLEFGWGPAIGIAGVSTRESFRNEGYAGRLIQKVLREYERNGVETSLLFARDPRLYVKLGFEPIDRVIRAPIEIAAGNAFDRSVLASALVQETYNQWASGHPDRLRRDELRWKYWNWNYRICEPIGSGYVCVEPGVLREGLWHRSTESLPIPKDTEWLGLTVMADQLNLTFTSAVEEMQLLGRNCPGIPQMFLTDQF